MTIQETITESSKNPTKKCLQCGEIFPSTRDYFVKDKSKKDGFYIYCKKCGKAYREANKDRKKEVDRQYREKNAEEIRLRRKEHYQRNKEKINAKNKRYTEENKEKVAIYIKEYAEKNKKNIDKHKKKYYEKNKEWLLEKAKTPEARDKKNKRITNLRKTNPKVKLCHNISVSMRACLKHNKKGRRSFSFLEFTVEELKKHLEKQFDKNMTWANHGEYWHIDHIHPISKFNFEKPEDDDFKRCWNLKNLRPLEAKKNIIKGNKLEKPLQMSLVF